MYIQHASSEITKNRVYVSILHWPSITDCWHRHTQTSHKVKTVFQYARGYIYSDRCCQDNKQKITKNNNNKTANKYTGKIHDVQINIVQQRISKTKNYGGKGGMEKKEKKKVFSWWNRWSGSAKKYLKHHVCLYSNIYNHTFKMLDASFQLFSREGVGGEGKRAHAMEGEAKKEDGQGEGGGGGAKHARTHTHARTHARTHAHTHTHTHTP